MRIILTLMILALGFSAPIIAQDSKRLAVVVNPNVNVDEVEYKDLKRILLGDRMFWNPGERITVIMPKEETWERTRTLESILDMTYGRYKFHWLAKINRDKALAAPVPAPSAAAVLELVMKIPGSFALIDSAAVTDDMKVLLLDGQGPNDENYAL